MNYMIFVNAKTNFFARSNVYQFLSFLHQKSNNPAFRRLSTRRGTMTAVMDRRKSLGLAKATKETTFREEDENQDEIYGARPRDVSKVST